MPRTERCNARHRKHLFSTVLWSAVLFGSLCQGGAAQVAVHGDTSAPLHRILVVPRDGMAAHTLAVRAQNVGGTVLSEQEQTGIAVVSASAEMEAALRADPDVAFVVQDRPMAATTMRVRPAALAGVVAQGRVTLRSNVPRLVIAPDTADTYYNNSPGLGCAGRGWVWRRRGRQRRHWPVEHNDRHGCTHRRVGQRCGQYAP